MPIIDAFISMDPNYEDKVSAIPTEGQLLINTGNLIINPEPSPEDPNYGYSVNNTDLFVDIDNGQVFVSNEDNPNGLEITQHWMHVSFSEDYYNNPEENSFINSENEIIIAAEFIPFSIQDKYNADLEDGGFILTSEKNDELSNLQINYFSDEVNLPTNI